MDMYNIMKMDQRIILGTRKTSDCQTSVPIYACPDFEERCHVHILDLYSSKLPVEVFLKDTFYMRPLPAIPLAAHLPWFTK